MPFATCPIPTSCSTASSSSSIRAASRASSSSSVVASIAPRARFTWCSTASVRKDATGDTQDALRHLGTKLDDMRTETPPFDPAPRVSGAIWVKPRLVAQLVYAEWTADGKLRQPAFLGLRTDKKPEECTWARRE